MIQRTLIKWWLLFSVLLFEFASAQSFKNKADLDSVIKSGFYAIEITPDLSSLLRTDFGDLRIQDRLGNSVPYLIESNLPVLRPDLFSPMKILKNEVNDSGQSVLIAENYPVERIQGFYIRIRNAAVSRVFSLSGSLNGSNWYSIVENLDLGQRFIQDGDSFLEQISFPLSSYRYFRVIVNNDKRDPLAFLSVQKPLIYASPTVRLPVQNPLCTYTRKDSAKITWLTVSNLHHFHISNIAVRAKSPRFFKRQVDIVIGNRQTNNFAISSDSVFNLNLPLFNDSLFTIKIYNEDNPPLDISGIATARQSERIVVYLEAGKSYGLKMTSPDAAIPHFDLINFRDSIPENIRTIGIANIAGAVITSKQTINSPMDKWWLWPSLIISLVIIGLFTYRLAKDVSNRS